MIKYKTKRTPYKKGYKEFFYKLSEIFNDDTKRKKVAKNGNNEIPNKGMK